MLDAGIFDRARPAEIHALHCGPFPVGQFAVMPGFGLPGLDRGIIAVTGPEAMAQAARIATEINALGTVTQPASPSDLERLVAQIQIPHGPLAEFVFMRAQAVTAGEHAEVRISYRCWPEHRHAAIRRDIAHIAGSLPVSFPADPFPAMICPQREGLAVKRHLQHAAGPDRVVQLHAAIPFNGEDFALFLDQIPGTYTFLGVRRPGAGIETSAPHQDAFQPDERAIGYGVRAMAGWLAKRTSN
jgi:metal-dependent amidase/aminoacylase/carboxypeptidase family protein